MAGKEQRGAEAAEQELFRGRPYVLTPVTAMTPRMREFESWVRRIQARVIIMSAAEHDNVVALTSHLPQLLSTAISVTLAEQGNPKVLEVFGPGLIDMTRLAISSSGVWNSILETNRSEVVKALQAFTMTLVNLANRLDAGLDVNDLFAIARNFALNLRNS
jgi:prephenate dehydrogenase